ncbi:MAG TPA: STAS domain-containing protein [Rhodocyclaceae bacterium]|nr:STAS domain-containing protein [Rhodocyclaceae bacterium]
MAGALKVEGAVTMWSAARQLAEGRERLHAGDLVVDFSGVSEADSAALGVLLDWCRVARTAGHALTIRGLPTGLRSLADLYGISELLPVEA